MGKIKFRDLLDSTMFIWDNWLHYKMFGTTFITYKTYGEDGKFHEMNPETEVATICKEDLDFEDQII